MREPNDPDHIRELNRLRSAGAFKHPALVEQYRALWADLWNDRRGASIADMEEVRAVILAFLVDEVPAATARMVALEHMKGLAK